MEKKLVADSKTEQVQILMAADMNGGGRLFGGQLMKWIDVVAGVVARRHAGAHVTTATIDTLQFKAAAFADETLVLKGQITHTGKTSMEVRVDTFAEDLKGEQRLINQAYLVMVAIDEAGNPLPVPGLERKNTEEEAEWQAGEKRRMFRLKRRKEEY